MLEWQTIEDISAHPNGFFLVYNLQVVNQIWDELDAVPLQHNHIYSKNCVHNVTLIPKPFC